MPWVIFTHAYVPPLVVRCFLCEQETLSESVALPTALESAIRQLGMEVWARISIHTPILPSRPYMSFCVI